MKVGRNEPCRCGSGKKYKKCCLEKDVATERAKAQAAAQTAVQAKRAGEEARLAEQEKAAREWEEQRKGTPLLEVDATTELEGSNEPQWPPLSECDQRCVDAWWDEVEPVYLGKGGEEKGGWLLQRTVDFLDQQPRLFRHLYLHDEFLFELGGALARAGQMDDYLSLLRRIRREQPDMYWQCFGYYDCDLIGDAIHTGRREEITTYLDLFKRHPVKHIDQFAQVVDLLAWRGAEDELRELLEATADTICDSPNVLGGDFGLIWLTYLALFPFIEAGDDSPETLEKLHRAALAVGFLDASEPSQREWLGRQLRLASRSPAEAGLDLKKSKDEWFRHDVAWSFTGWARRHKGLAWTSARFLANSLLDYWGWKAEKKNDARPFRLDEAQLDAYLAQRCHDLYWISGVKSMAMLQAFHYFADYLVAHEYFSAAEAGSLHSACARLFEIARKAVDACDPAYRLFPTYDALVAGANVRLAAP